MNDAEDSQYSRDIIGTSRYGIVQLDTVSRRIPITIKALSLPSCSDEQYLSGLTLNRMCGKPSRLSPEIWERLLQSQVGLCTPSKLADGP